MTGRLTMIALSGWFLWSCGAFVNQTFIAIAAVLVSL